MTTNASGRQHADAPSRSSAATRPLRILLADDDEINRAIVGHLLAECDAILTEATNGRSALELALTQRFDLLIFDLNMPEINGDRLIRHLRASQSLNAGSPMILFSAAVDRQGEIPGNRAASLANLLLPKPIPADSFVNSILRLTGRR
ncbi:response regulator [Xinfangfangia sp. CPCC 101601]|uniref:Response regulator n=1 Tax=Pseudogemmobacter lacusdianii TaxID=3069608 RepID=A0ABU0VTM5_9RHOB|nr:response regulator [Xinfangfangia sp. CPCC 101601]MDQ2065086.1 response regulator [Xinfangfangia sp. CPCC 101601]